MAANPTSQGSFFSPEETRKLLNISRSEVNRRANAGRLTYIWRGGKRMYHAGPILAQHQALNPAVTDGERDARAVEMIDAGASDAELIRALKLPLDYVRALRLSEPAAGAPSSGPPSSALLEAERENARAIESFLARRAELTARRRASLGLPSPPRPSHKKKKP